MTDTKALNVLIVHNNYQQKGGEDSVVESEAQLLISYGHNVQLYQKHNDDIVNISKLRLFAETIWSTTTTSELGEIIEAFKPDIVHCHNTFPLISPSIYWEVRKRNIPVVQTIHNFRLFCIQAMFLRQEKICEDCLGKTPLMGVARKCYKNSYSASAVAGITMQAHRILGTYKEKVTRFIALNNFCKEKLIEGGISKDIIRVKPNFVDLDQIKPTDKSRGGNSLFVGRVSPDKGVNILAAATTFVSTPIDIVGSGSLISVLENNDNLSLLGSKCAGDVYALMQNAPFLLMPSIWYENMPRTLVEAYACGLPVIASRLGALAELVEHGKTGLLFEPSSPLDLSKKIKWALDNPEKMIKMGVWCREKYEKEYSPAANYKQLISIYNEAASTNGS